MLKIRKVDSTASAILRSDVCTLFMQMIVDGASLDHIARRYGGLTGIRLQTTLTLAPNDRVSVEISDKVTLLRIGNPLGAGSTAEIVVPQETPIVFLEQISTAFNKALDHVRAANEGRD